MNKSEFKARWESSDNGGGITFDDVADYAESWILCRHPRTKQIDRVRYMALRAAGTVDDEEFNPSGAE